MIRATGVGSFPTGDPLAWARHVVATFPALPFAPEVPAFDPEDSLLRRPFAGALAKSPRSGVTARVAPPRLAVETDAALGLPVLLGQGVKLLGAALAERRAGPPPAVKLQTAGPATLGRSIQDKHGRALAATSEGRALARERVQRVGKALVEAVRSLGAREIVLFLDEPAPDEDPESLSAAVTALRAPGVRVGVHCCGPDWARVLRARPDWVGIDLTQYGAAIEKKPEPLRSFVANGGALALGVVPTLKFDDRFSVAAAADAARRLALEVAGDQASANALLDRSIVTPACGTALLDEHRARAIHAAAATVAGQIARK